MSLDALFEQILQSEQHAENRYSEILQVNKNITLCEKEIEQLSESNENIKLKIKEELSQLFDIQAEVEVSSKQSEILLQQRDKLKRNINDLKTNIKKITEKNEKDLNDFVDEVNLFIRTYDISGNAVEVAQNKAVEELEKLKSEEANVLKDLDNLKKDEENINLLTEDHACLSAELSHLRSTIIDLDSQVDDKKLLIQEENAKIEEVALLAQTDSEYFALQAELQSLDSKAIELEVIHLRARLTRLQQNRTSKDVLEIKTDCLNHQAEEIIVKCIFQRDNKHGFRGNRTQNMSIDCAKTIPLHHIIKPVMYGM